MEMYEDEAPDNKGTIVDENVELVKKLTNRFIDKKEFLKPQYVIVEGLGINQFGKHTLLVNYMGQKRSINLSNTNFNELIDLLGNKVSKWVGTKLLVEGSIYESDNPQIQNGISLNFKKAG